MPRSLEQFDRLFREYHEPVYRFFHNRGLSPQQAEELTQETFLQAYRSWKGFRGDSSPKTWLMGIATNLLHNHYRDRNRLKRRGEEIPYEEEVEEGTVLSASEQQGQPSPLDDTLAGERARHLRSALAELPEAQRQALTLQMDQELTYGEIAELLDEPEDRIKSRLYQARQKIKGRLEGQIGRNGYSR